MTEFAPQMVTIVNDDDPTQQREWPTAALDQISGWSPMATVEHYDPAEHKVDEVLAKLAELDDSELIDAIVEAEAAGRNSSKVRAWAEKHAGAPATAADADPVDPADVPPADPIAPGTVPNPS